MTRPRLWAAVPAVALIVMVAYNVAAGTLPALLWVCNVSAAALMVGLLLDSPVWVKAGALWLVVGAPLWLIDTASTGDWLPHSFITHLACPVIGLVYVRSRPAVRGAWWRADALLMGATAVARYTTPYDMNVNNSQHVAGPLSGVFTSYWPFFALHAVVFGAVLFVVEWAFDRTLLRPRRV